MNGDPLGVTIDIDRRRMNITERQIAEVLLPSCEPGSDIVGEIGHKIRRLCAVRKEVEDECGELVVEGKGATSEWQLKRALLHLIDKHIELEVWRKFPKELVGKSFVIYDGWRVGPQKQDTRTGDLFRIAEPKGRSTRSNDVNIGAVLHAPA